MMKTAHSEFPKWILFLLILFFSCENTEQELQPIVISEDLPLVDYDGNRYKTLRIGSQVWMAENLRVTHYSDGTPVQHSVYDNDTTLIATYGRLYTWSAFMRHAGSSNSNPSGVKGVSPDGWHIPSDSEWQELIENLGGESVAGGKLKESGLLHWSDPNTGANNETGFSTLPAGFHDFTGKFSGLGEVCFYATSTSVDDWEVYIRELNSNSASIERGGIHPGDAIPVRCIKDD